MFALRRSADLSTGLIGCTQDPKKKNKSLVEARFVNFWEPNHSLRLQYIRTVAEVTETYLNGYKLTHTSDGRLRAHSAES